MVVMAVATAAMVVATGRPMATRTATAPSRAYPGYYGSPELRLRLLDLIRRRLPTEPPPSSSDTPFATVNLTAPRLVTFVVSLALIALAVASLYWRIPTIGRFVSAHRIGFFIGGYSVLAAGVLFRRL